MKILITGANGQLGQALTHLLSESTKHQLLTSARSKSVVENRSWEHEILDIANEEQLNLLLDKHKPDAVINAAAMTHVDNCERQPEESNKYNYIAVKSLALACADRDIYLCHVSTDFVFNGLKDGAYNENDLAEAVNVYGKDKLKGEQAILATPKISASVLRTIVVYGRSPYKATNNMILWAAGALQRGEEITIITDQFRSITYVTDLAKACLSAVENQAKGLYHVSGPEGASVLEWINRTAEILGLSKETIKEITTAELNLPAPRPPKTYFDLTKARRDLNYQTTDFKTSLLEMFPFD